MGRNKKKQKQFMATIVSFVLMLLGSAVFALSIYFGLLKIELI